MLALIARVAAPLGVGIRLASRDLVRKRGRSVPAVAAIMATVFVGIFVMCIVSASSQREARLYRWSGQLGQVNAQLRWHSDPNESTSADRFIAPSAAISAARATLGAGDARVLYGVPDTDVQFTKKQLKSTRQYPTVALTCGKCDGTTGYVSSLTDAGSHLFVGAQQTSRQ